MANLDLISRVHLAIIYYHATKTVEVFRIVRLFLI